MRILCLLFLLQSGMSAIAQEEEKIKDIIESLAETSPEDEDLSELTDRLTFFRKHPINLHKTSSEELKSLIFLSPLQISNFFSYIANTKLLDVLELQAIPGFDPETINRLLPYVTISTLQGYEQIKLKKLPQIANHDLILRYGRLLQQQKGFKNPPGSKYLGSPEKLLLRYRFHYQDILSAALVMEKDAGEQLFNRSTGLDHLSASISLFKLGRIKKLIIGDYSLQFGQGLTLWSGFAFGKGPDVTSVAAKDVGLKPYTSANEASFFRGIASTIDIGRNIHLSSFISNRRLDASLKATADQSFTLSNINISGLHRTQTELKNQKSLKQTVYGGAVQYVTENLNIGFIAYQSDYQHQFVTGTQLYNKYSFTGRHLTNVGLHYNYTFRNIYFYGELAQSIGTGRALINGAMATLSRKLSAVVLHRSYNKDYHNFFSRAVSEGSETNNEKGWYMGLNYLLPRNLSLSIYGDYFKFPWLKYRVDSASAGYEVLSQLTYKRGKTFKSALRFKREQKQQNPDVGSIFQHLETIKKQSFRLEVSWRPNQKYNFQQRTEITQYQKGINKKESGILIYSDMDYTPKASKLSGNIRLAYFETSSYNSRIYAYENDVLYGSGSGIYAGNGIRSFINIRYRPVKKIDIWCKYAVFLYMNTKTIGTGLDEIEGNRKAEAKLQLRYQF